jgi:acyl-coenzyme A thioesterase PaaI-like protein
VGSTPNLGIAPSPVSLEPGEALAFAPQGQEASANRSDALTWSVAESGGGTVDSSGNYTAPQAEGAFHVVASSTTTSPHRATASVEVRRRGIRVRIVPSTASLATGDSATFTAVVRGTRPGQSTDVTWSVQEGPSGGTIDASGNYAAPGSPGTFHVVAASVADPSKKATATIAVTADQGVTVAVSPSNASTQARGSLSFKATVTGIKSGQSSNVTWSVQEGASGGSVDTSGNYTAPAGAATAHVVATSVADASKTATATVSVTAAPTIAVSIAPTTASVLAAGVTTFSATVTGASAGQSADVTWSVQEGASGGGVDASGRYTAPGTPGTFHVVATSVADTSKSATAAITVTAAPNITVTISPSSTSTQAGGTVNFTATVTGTSGGESTAVSWSVQEGAAGGTINGSGLYTAPSSAGTFHLIATSIADNNESASATVTVSSSSSSTIIPPDRLTSWNPGLNAVGGIPSGSWPICATLSPSGGDDAAAIQSALNSCGTNRVLKLASGTFRISRAVRIPSNVVLRGSGGPGTGAGQTQILQTSNQPNIQFQPAFGGFTQITDLAADAVKDTTSLTLTQVRSLTPGELVMIDELSDSSLIDWGYQDQGPGAANRGWFNRGPANQGEPQGRPTGQMMEVASVSGATVTFTTPFHITFRVSQKAQLVRLGSDNSGNGSVVPAIRNAGVEDLYVSGGVGGDNGANVWMHYCAYCWIRNIEADRSNGSSVAMSGTFRSVLRDSYLHSTVDPNPGGGGYGIGINWHSADSLVENNISWNFNKVMVMRASGGGNVIGYNYMDDGWIGYAPHFVEVGISASHMAGPMYELFEGNQSFNFDGDSTHGNANYITVFRNHFTGLRRAASPLNSYTFNSAGSLLVYEDAQNRRAIGLMSAHRYYTFIGNVLGYAGQNIPPVRSQGQGGPSRFDYGTGVTPLPQLHGYAAMWKLGWEPTFTQPQDQSVIATVIRDGNFDYVTNQVHWDRAAQPLPDSLYLSGKPAFFGSNTWPWVDALGGTKTFALPARQRFDVLHP